MGLFSSTIRCPACKSPGAKRVLWSTRCPNPDCQHYNPELRFSQRDDEALADWSSAQSPAESTPRRSPPTGSYQPPVSFRIEIHYTNHLGEAKTFAGDARTLRARGKHVSLVVAPTGRRIALATKRIGNWPQVQAAMAKYPEPHPEERRVLGYHSLHGTTSDLHRRLVAKYPEWDRAQAGSD